MCELPTNTLRPLSTYSSPSRRAVPAMPSTWPPDSGSVTAIVGRHSPDANLGSQARRWASEPKWMTLATPSCEACAIAPIAPLTRASSSTMIVLARCPRPRPPNSRGIVTPIQPRRAISRESSNSISRSASILAT